MIDLTVFEVPINNPNVATPEKATIAYAEVEKLILERSGAIHETAGLQDFLSSLHATFAEDERMVHQLTPEALSVYFKALERKHGEFLSPVVTKKAAPKAKVAKALSNLPEL